MRFSIAVISVLAVFLTTANTQYVLDDEYPALAIREALADAYEYNNVDIYNTLLAREAKLKIAKSAYLQRRALIDRKKGKTGRVSQEDKKRNKHCANSDCVWFETTIETANVKCTKCRKVLVNN